MKFLIPVLVGAVIGYITNWLAIKMLFRPYKEIRIFGLKVPFTPGLIPKERDRIAKSIGETIGTHLLTPEIVVEALCSERIDNQINVMINDKIGELRKSNLTVKEIGSKITGISLEEIDDKLEECILNAAVTKLGSDTARVGIRDFLHRKLTEGSKTFRQSELYENLMEYAFKNVSAAISSESAREFIGASIKRKADEFKLDSRKLGEVIPAGIQQSLRLYVYNNREKVAALIKEGLNNDKVRDKLKLTVSSMVEESLGKLVTMFISMDTIGNKVLEAIERYIDKPENQEGIAFIIINSIDRFMATDIRELADSLPADALNSLSGEMSRAVSAYLGDEAVIRDLRQFAEESFENSREKMIETVFENADRYLESFINSEEFRGFIRNLVRRNLIEGVLNKPLSLQLNKLSEKNLERVSAIIRGYYDEFIRTKSAQMVEMIDISGIVEERINSFDVAFGEKIILEVASRELSAITWLGALLGAIMGVFSPLIQMLTI